MHSLTTCYTLAGCIFYYERFTDEELPQGSSNQDSTFLFTKKPLCQISGSFHIGLVCTI